jgi:hypothetical protein
MKNVQTLGGVAALGLGITFGALIALLLGVANQGYVPGSGNDPAKALTFATATGVLFLSYAMLGFVGEPTLVNAYHQDRTSGEAAYLAMRVVSNALSSGAIFAADWAILLSGWAALATARMPKPLAYFLVVSGGLSVLAFILPLLGLILPLLYIVWSVWLGLVLLRRPAPSPAPVISRA